MENENAEPKFKRMYIRYNAQKVGFLGSCKPFAGLDGCHLKGRFGGQLMSATTKDGNNNIFPVIMAGLLPVMETLFPIVEYRYCVKYIYNNFKVNHMGMELKSVLWKCAGTTSVRKFERGMEHLKSLDEEAWKYLADIELAQWTRSHFSPRVLTDCLDMLEKLKLESKSFCAMPSRRFVYEVDNERERHLVDLVGRTCSYRVWDLIGILYKHGVAAIFVNREKSEDYTHPCYYKDAFVKTYKTPIPPMSSQSE
ncbi:uncharacterized protein LOC112018524 [Quercus suber]|uniref:uncharacterized protein LOC112018524 n=1 Tax=Quercus suber TaxID=58331 RepID=UPI000CE1AB5E|nr:uncharacterized protein LOC112018524 [Quercus suber]